VLNVKQFVGSFEALENPIDFYLYMYQLLLLLQILNVFYCCMT